MDPAAHLGDVVAAYLDGELDAADRAAAEAHLAACSACAAELEGEGVARSLVRALGPIEPPAGFLEGLLEGSGGVHDIDDDDSTRRRRMRIGLSQLAATAAVWLVVLGLGLGDTDVAPEVPSYLRAHVAAASALGTSDDAAGPADAAAEAQVPATAGRDFTLVRVTSDGGVVQAVYRATRTTGDVLVSVFVQRGMLDVSRLPADAEPVPVGHLTGYRVRRDGADITVVPRGGVVYTLVAPPSTATGDLPEDLPERARPEPGMLDRLEDAGRGLVDCFALAG